ncbi:MULTISPECIES: flagellin [Caulobacter]|jgi:flagellin|uniref:Flagellin n=1 Tax=Caulobacter rhizosphaerae TaxID=2010972 RepID=A0ABU1MUK5_9CAUL|nr:MULTISPECIES: flagellin [Caulobacter]KQZ32946.1 flagellin [Caulobacter sp. Root1472]MDR6529366.1 flagellin [Caulobacter rhizosphaerae]GGL22924.1 flagellin [Caulobacter rhizosphaerae]
MTLSVNTNQPALIALQNLNKTNDEMSGVQSRINTGLAISTAKDNAAVWSIAQDQRADRSALNAVKMSLDRATSITDVALAAGESVSDLLTQMREKVVAAKDTSLSTSSRTALNADFQGLLKNLTQVINSATFDGANILNGSEPTNITFLADADAATVITLNLQNLSLGGTINTLTATDNISTMTQATAVLTRLDTTMTAVNQAVGSIGSQAKQIDAHNTFVSKLNDVLETGVGNLVDADMAKESARLQALQVKQQLGAQALSIANQAPQIILSLFSGGS